MSRQLQWQRLQRRRQRCTICGRRNSLGGSRCRHCRARRNAYRNFVRAMNRARGRCRDCGGPLDGTRADRCRRHA